jgi:hypothetical protein
MDLRAISSPLAVELSRMSDPILEGTRLNDCDRVLLIMITHHIGMIR